MALAVVLLSDCAEFAPALAQDAPAARSAAVHPYAAHVAEAARRFGIPEAWIWAVMRVESGGVARAVSPAGAMGLMQIMPATWADLRARYRLGPDPFDARDNITAGAAYLRAMHDRYGDAGAMLAAYNAGPGRYDDHLSRGRYLPGETVRYLAQLAPIVGVPSASPLQLWANAETQPIEDASVEWPAQDSQYRTVATITLPRQQAYGPERVRYFDEAMTFRPAYSLAAHRPLGGVMRARLQVYRTLSAFRHRENGVAEANPGSIDEIPA